MANTETSVSNLKINRLTQTQLKNASSLSNSELYMVDPQFTGGKVLATDSNGDIVESDVIPTNIGTVKSVNNTSPDSNGNVAITIPTVNNATLTIQKNGTDVQTFTANASSNVTANITVPTDLGDLTNNAGYTKNTGTVTSVNNVSPVSGNVTLSIPTQASDIGAVATSDCAQIYPVIETYKSGSSWYRIYSDGWCEMGGIFAIGRTSSPTQVTLLKTFADTNYVVTVTANPSSIEWVDMVNAQITSKTVSSFNATDNVSNNNCMWRACGYLASGQYTGGTYKAYKP